MTVTEARDAFAQSSGYEFEDLMGGSPDDPLTGTNEKGEYLSFFVTAGAARIPMLFRGGIRRKRLKASAPGCLPSRKPSLQAERSPSVEK